MVIKDDIVQLVKRRLNRVLTVAEASLESRRFAAFRKIMLDEFGKSGFEQDLERVLGNRPHVER